MGITQCVSKIAGPFGEQEGMVGKEREQRTERKEVSLNGSGES